MASWWFWVVAELHQYWKHATRIKATTNCTTAQCGVSDEGIGLGAQVVVKGALIPEDSSSGHATTREASLISNAPIELPRKKPADVLIGVIDSEKKLIRVR